MSHNATPINTSIQLNVTFVLAESLLGSGTDDDDDDDNSTSTTATTPGLKHQHTGGVQASATPEANNNSLAPGDMAPLVGGPGSLNDGKTGQDDSEDQGKCFPAPRTTPFRNVRRHYTRHESMFTSETPTAALRRIQMFWIVASCLWVSTRRVSDDGTVFTFKGDTVK